jgi:AmmeMemoRadiSam system protein A
MSSAEAESQQPEARFDNSARQILIQIARDSIETALRTGVSLAVKVSEYSGELCENRACFVTLRCAYHTLRGCIGSSEAVRSLVEDVAYNAWMAASVDERFEPIALEELEQLHIHISVLSPLEPLQATSEEELLEQVRPGVDGILIIEGQQRGTLLPVVWEMVPDARRFLHEVRRKAGLPGDYWSDTMTIFRYTAESFD